MIIVSLIILNFFKCITRWRSIVPPFTQINCTRAGSFNLVNLYWHFYIKSIARAGSSTLLFMLMYTHSLLYVAVISNLWASSGFRFLCKRPRPRRWGVYSSGFLAKSLSKDHLFRKVLISWKKRKKLEFWRCFD